MYLQPMHTYAHVIKNISKNLSYPMSKPAIADILFPGFEGGNLALQA